MSRNGTRNSRTEGFVELVEQIYDATSDHTAWPEVLARIAAATRSPRALLLSHALAAEDGGTWAFHELGPEMMRPYMEHYVHADLWFQSALKRGLDQNGRVLTGSTLIEDDVLFRSEFYNDYLKPMDLFHLCSTVIHDGGNNALPHMHLSLYRPRSAANYDDETVGLMQRLYPHLRRALALNYRLLAQEKHADSLLDAAARLSDAAAVVDSACTIRFMNEAMERLLSSERALLATNSKLMPRAPKIAELFRRLVASVCDPIGSITGVTSDRLSIPRTSALGNIRVVACPVFVSSLTDGTQRGQAFLFFTLDIPHPDAVREMFSARYRLTPAETRVLERLVEGLSTKEIAARLGLSTNTVHTHAMRIYAKTDTHRQSILIRLFARFGA